CSPPHFCSLFGRAAAPTVSSTLSLHDALPIWAVKAVCHGSYGKIAGFRPAWSRQPSSSCNRCPYPPQPADVPPQRAAGRASLARSEEHTSELQSRENLVCRLLLEKKKTELHSN